jgi:hypothetical protein
MTLTDSKMKIYSRQELWLLFLMCSLPLHFWALILAFRDLSWLIERSNLWDAIGVASYGMIFAFAESVLVFLVALILGFLISKHWHQQRVALLIILVLITALWSMAGQLHALSGMSFPIWFLNFLVQQEHPVRVLYLLSLLLVSLTVLPPTYLILKSNKALRFVRELIDRLSLLAILYLLFDIVGLVIVIIRNI